MKRHRWLFFLGFLALAGWGGYWLAWTAVPRQPVGGNRGVDNGAGARAVVDEEVRFRTGVRQPGFRSDDEALAAGALPGQRALMFKDRAAMERFLAKLGDGVRLLGRIDALNALHVGFLDPAALAALLDGDEEQAMIFPAYVPNPKPGEVQDGVMGVGGELLRLLGITGDNSKWGTGVRVAILDTGVSAHPAFGSRISSIMLVPMSADPADWNGHGTAVASMVIGNSRLTPGVAPGAEVLSIRIADDQGESNSMLIAQGIVAAVDGGAGIINISLGSYGDSGLVRNAIKYANEAGVVIVAAAGNEGLDRLAFPAGNEGVIAVGAVDGRGTTLEFSNGGESLAASTPGYQVNAAWTGGEAVGFTGTSASAPIMAGAIAAAMSSDGTVRMTASQAAQLVLSRLDDGGAPGWDPVQGGGTLDMGRVMNANTPGIYDAAVASNYLVLPTEEVPYPQLQVVVQNRGTEMLVNAGVVVTTPFGTMPMNITTLPVNEIRTFTIPLPAALWGISGTVEFASTVTLSGGQADSNPSNNRRVESYSPAND
ncbi:MAG: S8 family serine peptidase [Akkermansiaceae bacterium]|nr:S8 family serine peptidase [Akkermansiaceae bacterium]